MPNILFYKGYTQYHNIGDQLINKSLLKFFRQFSQVVVSDKGMPDYYTEILALQETEKSSSRPLEFHLQLLKCAVQAIFKPQQKVYFLASPPGDQSTTSNVTGLKYILSGLFYLLLYLIGVRIIKIGFSLGPLSPLGNIGERFRALFVRHYYVRDSLSLQYAQRLGISQAKIFPDLCWTFQPQTAPIIAHDTGLDSRPKILLSFRSAVHQGSAAGYQQDLLQLIQALVRQNADQYQFEIVYQVASDAAFSQQLYAAVQTDATVHFHEQQLGLTNAHYYQSAAAVLTNRLHVALLAAKYGCLPIIVTDINKHVKIKGIFIDAGLQSLLLDTQQEAPDITRQLGDILVRRQAHFEQLERAEQQYSTLSNQTINDIFIT